MSEISLRLPEEWARAVAARVARTIRDACGQEADKNADMADQIDDACDAAVSATLQVLAEEFNGRDRLHDDNALATAVARAKRDALEEAAERLKTALADATRPSAILLAAGEMTAQECRTAKAVADFVTGRAIRALAATPPEDRQTETGWKPISEAPANKAIQVYVPGLDYYGNDGVYAGMLVDMGTGPRWMTFAWAMGRDMIGDNRPTHWRPLPAPPPPAIGNLEEEGRS